MADSPDPDVPAMPPPAPPVPIPDEPGGTRPVPTVDGTRNVAWPRLARMDDPPAAKGAGIFSTRSDSNSSPLISWIVMQVCGLGLLLGGYFLGQAWAPKVRTNPARDAGSLSSDFTYKAQRVGGERALEAANQALKAEKGHDLQTARGIYEDMLKRQAPMPRAEYRLALIALHQGDLLQADAHLSRSIKAGDAIADAYLFRASLASMRGDYADVVGQFAAAVRAEPFSAKLCFCWGEALRRDGKFPEAALRLTQALDRPDTGEARSLYLFKLRLAKIEAGADPSFDNEFENALARPEPNGEWLMLAAAREVGRKDYSEAAALLRKAKSSLPPEVFSAYAQDFVFQTRRARPEFGSLLTIAPPAKPSGDLPLQDPAAWSVADADPAVWPPFPNED